MIVATAKFLAVAIVVSVLLPPGSEMLGEVMRGWLVDEQPSVVLVEGLFHPARVSLQAAAAP